MALICFKKKGVEHKTVKKKVWWENKLKGIVFM
jgi:hypothetical protein